MRSSKLVGYPAYRSFSIAHPLPACLSGEKRDEAHRRQGHLTSTHTLPDITTSLGISILAVLKTMTIPRFNPSDPRIPEQVQPFRIAPPKDTFASGSMYLRIVPSGHMIEQEYILTAMLSFLNSLLIFQWHGKFRVAVDDH